jgi:hypothetical protein
MLKIKGDKRTRKPGVMHWSVCGETSQGGKIIACFYIMPDNRRLGATYEVTPRDLLQSHEAYFLGTVFQRVKRQLEATIAGVGTVHPLP